MDYTSVLAVCAGVGVAVVLSKMALEAVRTLALVLIMVACAGMLFAPMPYYDAKTLLFSAPLPAPAHVPEPIASAEDIPVAEVHTFSAMARTPEEFGSDVPPEVVQAMAERAASGGDGAVHNEVYRDKDRRLCVYRGAWSAGVASVAGSCATLAEEMRGETRRQEFVLTGGVTRACVIGDWFQCSERVETAVREVVEPRMVARTLTLAQQQDLARAMFDTLPNGPLALPSDRS